MPRIASFDVVLFGATGFTGGLTAGYLAANAPEGARWALAGRNMAKLEEVRSGLGRLGDVPLLQADATDSAGLAAIARETRVVISTVGPYLLHGEPLVRACAEAGTDYVDLCGEPEFVDRMYLLHHDTALRTGARLVHACGFDSVPHDLGVYFTVKQLDAAARVRIRGVVRTNGSYSGGTLHSAMTSVSRARQMRAIFAARRRAEGRPAGRTVRAIAGRPGRDPDLGYWLLPLPTIDPHIVVRSAAAPRCSPSRRCAWRSTTTRRPPAR